MFESDGMNKRTVRCVLIAHEGCASFDLCLEDSIPELLRFDRLLRAAFLLVFLEKSLELISPDFVEARCFVGAE